MIVENLTNGGVATVTMTKFEARVLHDALIIAKLQVGPDLLLGQVGRREGFDHIELMRAALIGIAKS